ncbi:MAG: F0F1 ATP synthase subunit B [Burkholderiaceae bacterium]
MLIDWFTVGAQALNFIVLVWLLKRFLYQPVLDAIATREGLIARQIADAAATKRSAEALQQSFVEKSEAFDRERGSLFDQAARDAQAERERLLAAARKAADELGAQRQEALRSETALLQRSLGDSTRREVFEITRRVLADLATASLEERLADVFVRRLGELDDPARDGMAAALTAPEAHAVVQSAFALPDAQRAAIQSAVNACVRADIAIEFVTAPELVSGIELIGAGRKLAWSIDQYLDALERTIADLMAPPNPATASPTAPAEAAGSKPTASPA